MLISLWLIEGPETNCLLPNFQPKPPMICPNEMEKFNILLLQIIQRNDKLFISSLT